MLSSMAMCFLDIKTGFNGEIWKSLERQNREALECGKHNLMRWSRGLQKDQKANRHMGSENHTYDVLDGSND